MNARRDEDAPDDAAGEVVGEVVVGVDGSPAALRAVDYAIEVARASGAAVRLVHAVPQIGPLPPLSMVVGDIVHDNGRVFLEDVVARARTAAPDLPVRHALVMGPRNAELALAAKDALMLVLGRRDAEGPHGLPTGSVAAAVSAAVECPVRVVAADWRSRPHGPDILVGIKDVTRAGPLVRRGLELAEASGGVLVLAHAWYVPSGYESILTPDQVAERNAHAAAALEDEVADLRLEHPHVPVQAKVLSGRPHQVLATLARDAQLLLLGRPAHSHVFAHAGRTTRYLLQNSPAPVEVGPRATEPAENLDEDGLSLEERGAMLR